MNVNRKSKNSRVYIEIIRGTIAPTAIYHVAHNPVLTIEAPLPKHKKTKPTQNAEPKTNTSNLKPVLHNPEP